MGDERGPAPPPEPGDPHWMPLFDDLMAAAALVYEESEAQELRASFTYETGENQAFADRAKERARQLKRAAAVLDWVARRADRLTLLSQGPPRERRR